MNRRSFFKACAGIVAGAGAVLLPLKALGDKDSKPSEPPANSSAGKAITDGWLSRNEVRERDKSFPAKIRIVRIGTDCKIEYADYNRALNHHLMVHGIEPSPVLDKEYHPIDTQSFVDWAKDIRDASTG